MPERSQKGCFGSKSSGRVPKADEQSERDMTVKITVGAGTISNAGLEGECVCHRRQKAGNASEDTRLTPGLHPSLEGWPETTVGQRGQNCDALDGRS